METITRSKKQQALIENISKFPLITYVDPTDPEKEELLYYVLNINPDGFMVCLDTEFQCPCAIPLDGNWQATEEFVDTKYLTLLHNLIL